MTRRFRNLVLLVLLAACAAGGAWGVRELQRWQLGERVAALAGPGDIEMYSATTCGICARAKRWFSAHRIDVRWCEIDRDADCKRRFYALHGKGTPLIVVRGVPQAGFDRERIASALQAVQRQAE